MDNLSFRTRFPVLFSMLVAGTVLVLVGLSMALVPHEGFAVGERFALALVVVVGVVARVNGLRAGVVAALLCTIALVAAEVVFVGRPSGVDTVDFVVDLAIFLTVAMIQGIQTGEQRDQEREMLQRRHETDLLVRLSAQLVPDSQLTGVLEGLSDGLRELLGNRKVTLFVNDGEGGLTVVREAASRTVNADPELLRIAKWVLHNAAAVGPTSPSCHGTHGELEQFVPHVTASASSERDDMFLPLVSMSGVEGVLCVSAGSDGAPDCHEVATLQFIAKLLAMFQERKRLAESAAQIQSVVEADRLKSALVSSVSHELRTPLAAATATVSSLLEEDSGEAQLPQVARDEMVFVADALHELDGQIARVLEYSRLEASQWRPSFEWNDINDAVAVVRDAFPQEVQARIRLELAGSLSPYRFDFVQLTRALHHVVENALSYSRSDVIIRTQPAGDGVTVLVEDAGPGVPDSEKTDIFDRFHRGSAASCRPHGTGLGLAIVRDIVDAHAGRVWVEDIEGGGARFVVLLPNAARDPEEVEYE